MSLSWDIIYWDGEHTTDYVPSIWANNSKTEYKLPAGPRMTESKKRTLIYTCTPLQEGTYNWYKATCKKQMVVSLEKAKQYCRKSMVTSNLESENSSVGSSEDEAFQMEQLKSSRPKKSFRAKGTSINSDANVQFEMPIIDMPVSLADGDSLNSVPGIITLTDLPNLSMPATEASLPSTSSSSMAPLSSIHTKLDIIIQRFSELKFYSAQLTHIGQRMEKIESTLQYVMERDLLSDPLNETRSGQNILLNILPLSSVDSLQEYEAVLAKDEIYKKSLEDVLFLVGGDTFHKSIYNIMKKLLSPELSLMYSGQGKKKKLPFCNLHIYSAITTAVRRRFPDVADMNIKKSVALFLASARDRIPKDANGTVIVE